MNGGTKASRRRAPAIPVRLRGGVRRGLRGSGGCVGVGPGAHAAHPAAGLGRHPPAVAAGDPAHHPLVDPQAWGAALGDTLIPVGDSVGNSSVLITHTHPDQFDAKPVADALIGGCCPSTTASPA